MTDQLGMSCWGKLPAAAETSFHQVDRVGSPKTYCPEDLVDYLLVAGAHLVECLEAEAVGGLKAEAGWVASAAVAVSQAEKRQARVTLKTRQHAAAAAADLGEAEKVMARRTLSAAPTDWG